MRQKSKDEPAASRLAALQSERDYAVGAMREAREYLNIETAHAREAEAKAAALQQRVEEARALLESIAPLADEDSPIRKWLNRGDRK